MYMYIVELLNPKTGTLASSKQVQTFLYILTFYLILKVGIHKQRQRTTRLIEQFPGLPKFPIFGSAFTRFTLNVTANPPKYLLDELHRLVRTHGKIFKWWNLSTPKIVIADPELAIVSQNTTHFLTFGKFSE